MRRTDFHSTAEFTTCKSADTVLLIITEAEEKKKLLFQKLRRFCEEKQIVFGPDELHETDFLVATFRREEDLQLTICWLRSLGATGKRSVN